MLLLLIFGLVIFLVYLLFQRVIKPFVRLIFRVAVRGRTADPQVERLVAAHQRIHQEQQEIDRAMLTNPSDPALLGRIEQLTAEVEGTDRAVLQRLNRGALRAFGSDKAPRPWRRLWRREHRPKLHRLVRVGVLLLVLTGAIHVVAVVLTQGRQHPSHLRGSPETTFRVPGSSGYTSSEIVSMVEHKVSEDGVFSPALETITCPEGTYTTGALVTCTLHSPKGGGNFDVEVTATGISIKLPDEPGSQ